MNKFLVIKPTKLPIRQEGINHVKIKSGRKKLSEKQSPKHILFLYTENNLFNILLEKMPLSLQSMMGPK